MIFTTKQTGDKGEAYAAKYLKKHKYKIIARNYKKPYGEIDIIAENKEVIAFVEVKTRKENSLTQPIDAVNRKKQMRISKTADAYMYENNIEKNFLSDDEVYNISIRKGTLTKEEKDIMNSHATLSYEMLSALPFPKKYSNIMHIAVNHHEKLNGKGYPRGLSEQEIALEDRILILADIFEALSSNDRPYKGVKKLSEIFKILDFMVKDGEIDKDLLDFFKNSRAFKEYCETELLTEQLDV